MRHASSPEDELVDLGSRLEKNRVGYQALHLHLSRLQPRNRTRAQVELAASLLRKFAETYDDHLIRLSNDDIALVCRGKRVQKLFDVVTRIRAMVEDDPLFEADVQDLSKFATWHDLSIHWSEFMANCQAARIDALARRRGDRAGDKARNDGPTIPLDAQRLSQLEQSLKVMDASTHLRRSPVGSIDESGRMTIVYEELSIDIRDLQHRATPNVDLKANPWLFRQLTRTLDHRMLRHLLRASTASLEQPIGINLNLSLVNSADFLKVMERFRSVLDYRPIIEVQASDVFANTQQYRLARDARREIGYLLCLSGIDYLSLPILAFENLGVDLYKLGWVDDVLTLNANGWKTVTEAVRQAGAGRFILGNCNSADAMTFGRDLGIAMFQGELIAGSTPRRA